MKIGEVSNKEDPRDLHFEEKGGYCALQGASTNLDAPKYTNPFKTKKYNTAIEENSKNGNHWRLLG